MFKSPLVNYSIFAFSIILLGCSNAKVNQNYLTKDGVWCWFSDPRAIFHEGKIVTGWVKEDGTIEAATLDPNNGQTSAYHLYPQLEPDDHDNPAFTSTDENGIIACYTTHSGKDGFYLNYGDITNGQIQFSDPVKIPLLDSSELQRFPKVHVTYANPYRLKNENNRIYCFGRWTGYKPNMMWSDDHGKHWTKSKVFITNHPFDPNNRPYVKYYSDGQSKIHMVFTDGHPRVEPTNSVYYACYENGTFYRADGTVIRNMQNLPFEPKDADVVYQSNETQGRAWIADLAQDPAGQPVILYTRSPSETDHRYWYARYDGKNWQDYEICKSGKWFPQTQADETERETYYFGNLSVNPQNTNVVYLSRQVNQVFEIERWETSDYGKTWKSQPITQNSTYDNVRPYIPRGDNGGRELVLWMENQKYIHYTDYRTSIKYAIVK